MNGLTKFLAPNNINRSNSMHISRSNETTLDPKIAEILDASLRQNGFGKPKKQEPEKIENTSPPPPQFGRPKSPAAIHQPRDILEEEIFEECSKAIAILNKYRFKQEPEANQRRNHPSISHFSRETEATTKEEPKSYKQLWKEGKDLREFARDKNALYAIIYENELLGNNTYLRQHLNRRIRGSSAALIIQRWFRDQNSQKGGKKSLSPQHPKQEWVGLLSNKGNLDSKIKKRQTRRNQSRSRNPSCYGKLSFDSMKKTLVEYEELETENGSLPMRNNHSAQKKILEEVSIQLKGNLEGHSGKKLSTNKKNKLDKENFSLEREEFENNTTPKKNLDLPLKRTSPVRVNKNKGGVVVKVDSASYKESEKAAVKIQRAFRKHLFRSRNESYSFERENLSAELVRSQQENEKLREIVSELENNIEKKIEERVGIEKVKFKELLDQYTQFIDKLLQEKVDITQYYEIITASNQEMKLKLKTYEEKDYENIISNLQLENQKLLSEKSQILKDLQNAKENNQQSLLKDVVQTLEDENETLKKKLHDFQSELQKYINETEKAHETNSLLLQKLRSSEVRISELEEKLEISENKCRGLLEMAKNSLYNSNSMQPPAVENLKSRIYIPRMMPENIPPPASENLINQSQQSQRNDYSPRKFDEDYILSVRNNTESETQSIAETHRDRDQKPALHFKLVSSECDLPPDSGKESEKNSEQINADTDRLAPPEANPHLEFSFEGRDSSRQYDNNNNAIIESFEVDPTLESNRVDEHIENKQRETHQHIEKIFEYRKMSQEYFSGKFVDETEEHYQDSLEDDHHHHHHHNRVHEHVIDEEDQSLEINLLIENISKKLELAKLNRDNDNHNEEAVENAFREHIKFAKALSLPRFEETERSPLHQETNKMRNLSQKNLHQNGLLFEDEEEGAEIQHENPPKDQKQPNNIKRGILDTLKKADLLFGRANHNDTGY